MDTKVLVVLGGVGLRVAGGAGVKTQDILELAAQVLGEQRDPSEWAGWVVYILEALQNRANADDYARFLESLQESIGTRLEGGRW